MQIFAIILSTLSTCLLAAACIGICLYVKKHEKQIKKIEEEIEKIKHEK